MRTIGEPGGNEPVRYDATRALTWAAVFLVATLVLGFLAFSGLVSAAAAVAKMLFYLCLIVFVVAIIAGLVMGRRRV